VSDARQTNLLDAIDQAEERERAAAQTLSTTRAVRCECGAWVFDERKRKVCGLCGRRFSP